VASVEHLLSAGETSRTLSAPSQAGWPALPSSREEAPGQVDGPLAEWEHLWIDLGGEG
jgi:hypothetical protein